MMEAESPLSAFESAAVVSLRPGDVLLFRTPLHLRQAQRDLVIGMLNEVFPDHESIVLEGGQDLAIVRPEPGFFARLFRRRQNA